MATKLFVGRISFNTTDASLRTLFEQYGTVTIAEVAKERNSEKSRGFGFVEMESASAAEKAVNMLDGREFEGRIIVVNSARPRQGQPREGGMSFGGGFQQRR